MGKLTELIGRLEAAREGSRPLDWLIAEELGDEAFRLKAAAWPPFAPGSKIDKGIPAFTTSLDAIVARIERSNWKIYSVDASIDGRPSCFIKGPDRVWPADDESDEYVGPGWEHGRAKSLPLALCIAFLRSLQAQQETSEDE